MTEYAMNIKRIQIKNFKVFKDARVENLGKMNVFLGVNGSGKSTLSDVFGFLSDALQNNITVAVNRRGGFSEVITRGCNTVIRTRNLLHIPYKQPLNQGKQLLPGQTLPSQGVE